MTKLQLVGNRDFERGLDALASTLADAGFSEAALLVGAASLSVAETLLYQAKTGQKSGNWIESDEAEGA